MRSFLKPLTTEEETQYLKQMKEGDLEARSKLIEHNLRLVAHIVKKYNNMDRDLEDLISIGTIGLIKAVDTYDISKGNKLVTYASRCIENELLMLFRKEKKCSKEVSIYEPIGTDKEGNEISLMDIIGCEDESVFHRLLYTMNKKKLYEELAQMADAKEKKVLILRYGLYGGEELPQREVGKIMGISRSYVSRIEKRALESLRRRFVQ
ncbi:MAG: sigma-70 family RNA polymerase sigma factor [Lachnospiraceae bacterium]|nr:sigma-70 family RNA polymerase sigma factor [Lachnospiraceae bacterium]